MYYFVSTHTHLYTVKSFLSFRQDPNPTFCWLDALTPWSIVLQKLVDAQWLGNSLQCIEPGGSLPHSQEAATESSQHL
jgi:hypothetical protein